MALRAEAPFKENLKIVIESGHSRFPVHGDEKDEILGILLAKDLLRCLADDADCDIRLMLRPVALIPESKKLNILLKEFRLSRNHMAIVVDEYGGTAGIVTLEDLVEEIIGEIRDEYDTESGPVKQRGIDQWEVEADFSLHDFGAEIGVEFPEEGEASSVGGFVAEHLGRIPARGAKLSWGRVQFEVLDASERRVKRVLVKRLPPPVGED